MEATIKIALTPEGNLELPPEIRDKFSNGEKYSVITNGDTIVFTKVPKVDWNDLRKRRKQLGGSSQFCNAIGAGSLEQGIPP